MSKLILTHEVSGLGTPGDVVDVKNGYARNYLLPRKLALVVKAGEGGRLFGSVKTTDVAEAVAAAGLGAIDKRKIELSPIKLTGEHEATVRLRDELSATITLQVVAAK